VLERRRAFLTFGFCPTYTPFVEHHGYFCTDLRLPYWGDIFLQPGKLSDADSNYMFMRSWWQTKDIEALIDSQGKPQARKDLGRGQSRASQGLTSTKDNKAKPRPSVKTTSTPRAASN
jgi:hypothetical protein